MFPLKGNIFYSSRHSLNCDKYPISLAIIRNVLTSLQCFSLPQGLIRKETAGYFVVAILTRRVTRGTIAISDALNRQQYPVERTREEIY